MIIAAPSSFAAYLSEIDRTPLLSAAEEKSLAVQILGGDAQARDHMVRANLRLVVNVARGYAGRGLAIEDLVSEGNMGLLRAVEGFDPTMNTRFRTYACFWIKQSIKRTILNTVKTIRVPAYMAELLTKWRRTANKLADELGRVATDCEIAELLGLSKKKVSIIRQAIRVATAGVQPDRDEGGGRIEEMLMEPGADAPGAEMRKADSLKEVLQFLEKMDRREATVLRMRFGLTGEEPKTLKEIGVHFGLTRERVRQIENEALAKLAVGVGREGGVGSSRVPPVAAYSVV